MKGEDRLGAMVLHIVSRCGGRRNFGRVMLCRLCYFSDFGSRRNFGRVMLCRLCYFSDFGSYELRGESISGSGYVLANGGPEPAGFDFLLDDLTRRKMLRVSFRHGAVGYSANPSPGLSLLTSEDIALIDRAIDMYGGMNERILSWISREDAPCMGRHPSEPIDYSAVRFRDGRTSALGWIEA